MTTSNTSAVPARAERVSFTGIVENANKGGLKFQQQQSWLNYGNRFEGRPPQRDAILGALLTVSIVYSQREGKHYILSVDSIVENPTTALAPPSSRVQSEFTPSTPEVPASAQVHPEQPAPASAGAPANPSGPRVADDNDLAQMNEAAKTWEKSQISDHELDMLATVFFGKASRTELTRYDVWVHVMPFLLGINKMRERQQQGRKNRR